MVPPPPQRASLTSSLASSSSKRSSPPPPSSSLSSTVRPYQGYSTLVPTSTDSTVALINASLSSTISSLSTLSAVSANPSTSPSTSTVLHSLQEDCIELQNYVASRTSLPASKVSLINALSHYLSELPTRTSSQLSSKTTADARFHQLSRVIRAICSEEMERQHPALLLGECDKVLEDIEREERSKGWLARSWAPSSLKRCLAPAVQRQWVPILIDTKSLLFRTGSGLIALGSSCIVGRLALLYPLTLVCIEAVTVIAKLVPEESAGRSRITVADVLRLAKAGGLLYASTLVLSVLMVGFSYGFLCLLGGSALLACRASDSMCKQLAAPVGVIGVPLSRMAETVQRLMDSQTGDSMRRMTEGGGGGGSGGGGSGGGGGGGDGRARRRNVRIEEIRD